MESIDTTFNGYKFRSRLEARWAVFFETLEIEYIYEPQGYVLDDGTQYLPDFFLPDLETFAEVKFDVLNTFDYIKARNLVEVSNVPLIVLDKDPSFSHFTQILPNEEGVSHREVNLTSSKELLVSEMVKGKQEYINRGFKQAAQAIKAARSHRFGIFD